MFFANLESFGKKIALVLADGGRVTYGELAERADLHARRLADRRCLLAIEMLNDVDAIAAYLGALRSGCPAILLAEGATGKTQPIMTTFQPELAYVRRDAGWTFEVLRETGDHDGLHPELALMLSTSGTTGSPKLVKLSRSNLHENARSIAEYLEITPERRAITNLPLHYSYGLSVLNSHLFAGASIVLTDLSVVDEEFWKLFRREQVTDLPGVPYTYELLERVAFRNDPPPSLEVMTQAGGRLPPDLVRRYAEFGRERGIRFFVMYGQTEATARMAYLPPERTLENSDCIGVAIPRGKFEIRDASGGAIRKPGMAGELVYQGPNVMMGYGMQRGDLAAPPNLSELPTQDLAEWTQNGFVKIVGRASRFSKIMGLRIGLDDVERVLREAGRHAYVTGTDEFIAIALVDGAEAAEVRRFLAERFKLPPHTIFAFNLEKAPVLPSGKIDYVTIRAKGQELHARQASELVSRDESVRVLFAKALGHDQIGDDMSFASLGGDSLSYVVVSQRLESRFGKLPQHWERLTVRELDLLLQERGTSTTKPARTTTLPSDVLLRVLAISTIFIGHAAPDHTLWLRGGSAILFCLAGYSLCRFQREQLLAGRILPAISGALQRIILPYLLLMTVLLFATGIAPHPSWWTLSSVFFVDTGDRGILFSFWFIESLFQCMLIAILPFLVPAYRRWAQARPFEQGAVTVGIGIAALFAGRYLFDSAPFSHKFDGWLYIYLIGWTFALADSAWQKTMLVVAGSVVATIQFGADTSRPYWLMAALVVLATLPGIRLPSVPARALSEIAAVSYMSYLAHPLVTHLTKFVLPTRHDVAVTIFLSYVGTIAAGFAGTIVWNHLYKHVVRILSKSGRMSESVATDRTVG